MNVASIEREVAGKNGFGVPQMRTLLLTDLCDSTELVERVGDAASAALFRGHDTLVLELQRRWRGRLIDRSDGMLLLFERAIDGLGFALDYARELRTLGTVHGVDLRARAGLHVGEVLTWRNSDEAVQVGAKPLEVEGLAKPMAGRLMAMARPGQILLSAVAEPLAHRAARELGERGEHLLWKSYGRWRFKGVPEAQEVYEVGEAGIAPLRVPKNSPKAWRDLPFWRRPAALAAEAALLAAVGIGTWFATRPAPAIAFNERDWVVMGDMRNLTGQPVLDESLAQAFRISLEQSRHVNVLSDLKVRDTLALMKRDPGTTLDRAVASEIALRDGARAVVLPTVAEIGGRVRVSAEIVDPNTQATVYAESADGSGAGSVLGSIDTVTAALRGKLGEALKTIQRDSAPLPQVSTANLDALKAYALGDRKRNMGELKEALSYYKRAVELDPQFALAHLAQARVYTSLLDQPARRRELELARAMRDHLTPREALMLDAEIARSGPVLAQLERWQQLIELYPDSCDARFTLAQEGMFYANRYAASSPHIDAAIAQQCPRRATALYLQGIQHLGMERPRESIASFEASRRAGFRGAGMSHVYAYAAMRDFKDARRVLDARRSTGVATAELDVPQTQMLLALDGGRFDEAARIAASTSRQADAVEPVIAGAEWRSRALFARILSGNEDAGALRKELAAQLQRVQGDAQAMDALFSSASEALVLGLGYAAARLDDAELVSRSLAATAASPDVAAHPMLQEMREVLAAEQDRLRGSPALAVQRLRRIAGGPDALIATHVALERSARAAGDRDLALRQAEWIAAHRGRAYVEGMATMLPVAFNLVDTTSMRLEAAELQAEAGDGDAARKGLADFLAAWPREALPAALGRRVDRLEQSLSPRG